MEVICKYVKTLRVKSGTSFIFDPFDFSRLILTRVLCQMSRFPTKLDLSLTKGKIAFLNPLFTGVGRRKVLTYYFEIIPIKIDRIEEK